MDTTIDQLQYFSLMEQAECEMEMFDYFCQMDYIEMSQDIKLEAGKFNAIATQFFITLKRIIKICVKMVTSAFSYVVSNIKDDFKYSLIAKKAEVAIKKLSKNNPRLLKKIRPVPQLNMFFSPKKALDSISYRKNTVDKYTAITIDDFLKDNGHNEKSIEKIANLLEKTYMYFSGSDFAAMSGKFIPNIANLNQFENFNPKTADELNLVYEKYRDFLYNKNEDNRNSAYNMVAAQAVLQCSYMRSDSLCEIINNSESDNGFDIDKMFEYAIKYWDELSNDSYFINSKLISDFIEYCRSASAAINKFKNELNGVNLDLSYIDDIVTAISKKQNNAEYDQRLINIYVMCAKDYSNLTTKYLTSQMKCMVNVKDFYYSCLTKIINAYEKDEENMKTGTPTNPDSIFGQPDRDGMYSFTPHYVTN